MHVELVTNIIINANDDMDRLKALACWIKDELGSNTPWHITRFFPQWSMSDTEPTPLKTLESISDMALTVGLNYVYIGNVPDHPRNHTYCPGCGNKLIERRTTGRIVCKIDKDECPVCGEKIVGKFMY
jgi:pyruvate formate lyase activating enzyme